MTESLTGVVLAAGQGLRLHPHTLFRPKPLVHVGGEPLLGRTLDAFAAIGVRDVVVVAGYRAGDIRDFVAARPGVPRVQIVRNDRYDRSNNAVSLSLAKVGVPRGMLLVDGDLLFDPEILARVAASDEGACVAVERRKGLGAEEIKVRIRPDGAISEINKVMDPSVAIGEAIGIARFSATSAAELWARLEAQIEAGRHDLFYERAFEELVAMGRRYAICDITGLACLEIDTPADLAAAQEMAALPAFARAPRLRAG
jgi:choline kinase